VTASNLFKYCQPCHGLVLLKRHHPLRFTLPELADLLLAAEGWFGRAAAEHPRARHPFLLWNCGARAGASQFHGHAQVLLSQVRGLPCLAHYYAASVEHIESMPERAWRP
jgi:ATP adenylyltransferase/5',5'''-P-1,P-4-tetraphosphate phosphorylase II